MITGMVSSLNLHVWCSCLNQCRIFTILDHDISKTPYSLSSVTNQELLLIMYTSATHKYNYATSRQISAAPDAAVESKSRCQ